MVIHKIREEPEIIRIIIGQMNGSLLPFLPLLLQSGRKNGRIARGKILVHRELGGVLFATHDNLETLPKTMAAALAKIYVVNIN